MPSNRMNALQAPAVRFMGRLDFRSKFLLLGIVLTIPMLVVTALQMPQTAKDTGFLRNEHIGLQYAGIASQLLHDMQQHRGLSMRFAAGDQSLKPQLEAAQAGIAKSFAALEQLDQDQDD